MTTTIEPQQQAEERTTRFLSLDLTRKCQLECVHCYNESGPDGTHGTMTREDWVNLLDQAAALGVATVQFIGGEPTMHPDFPELVERALWLGLAVEVFSNFVHISPESWELFQRPGIGVATSYYSDQAGQHDAMTGRPSHRKTRANIERAVNLGVSLRVGIITNEGDDGSAARRDLEDLGVTSLRIDQVRPFGRGAHEQTPDMANLCGHCGTTQAAVSPTGEVSPCVMSQWCGVGNVKTDPLAAILKGTTMGDAKASIRAVVRMDTHCGSDDECSPGTPGSDCTPRR